MPTRLKFEPRGIEIDLLKLEAPPRPPIHTSMEGQVGRMHCPPPAHVCCATASRRDLGRDLRCRKWPSVCTYRRAMCDVGGCPRARVPVCASVPSGGLLCYVIGYVCIERVVVMYQAKAPRERPYPQQRDRNCNLLLL